ncbi:hypothetical protein BDV10DRAFT_161387 [Aspergillus recurvatus]
MHFTVEFFTFVAGRTSAPLHLRVSSTAFLTGNIYLLLISQISWAIFLALMG